MTPQEMIEMRKNGATYQKIADMCDTSRQNIHEAVKLYEEKIAQGRRGRKFSYKKIKYKGIYEYFKNNEDMCISGFAQLIYGSSHCNNQYYKIRAFIIGENNSHFTIPQIKRICEIVGKPFEEVFAERSDTE